jgi:hypothetical protein
MQQDVQLKQLRNQLNIEPLMLDQINPRLHYDDGIDLRDSKHNEADDSND